MAARLSTMDLGSVGLVGFLKASAEEAQSSPLKRLRSFILSLTGEKLQAGEGFYSDQSWPGRGI